MSEFVDRRDLDFMLFELLGVEGLFDTCRYASFDRSTIEEIFNSSETLAAEKFHPCAAAVDAHEPRYVDGEAITHPETKAALAAFADSGLFAAGFNEELGGLQLPYVAQTAMHGMFSAANGPVFGYAMLTIAAANMLVEFASEEQKGLYLPPMLEGRWFGTMCLSETQAGSSLADIRTKAEPRDDGTYSISGSKMWISGAEQDISENIINMVLAKIPGGPPGVRGISLFIVPKFKVNDDGSLAEKNNVLLAGLNHKMGQRGITNTLLNFGDGGETIGYRVGEEHQGLRYMFHMMNEARILIGHAATMSGLAGYLYSTKYAKERRQGRNVSNRDPESPQVPLTEHADVRRLLLSQKANVEGALALVLYSALIVDQLKVEEDPAQRARLALLLEILTPIAKSWPSEFCLEANKHAMQVLGGYGYTRDYPVERFYRDNRLNPIHEGAHAIHGIDLLGRKVGLQNGAALDILCAEISTTLQAATDAFPRERKDLASAVKALRAATEVALACDDLDKRLANATLYLDSAGHIVVAWLWLQQALVATERPSGVTADDKFYSDKVTAMRFFFRYELPKVFAALELISSLDDTALNWSVT